MSFTIDEFAQNLDGQVLGDGDLTISDVASLDNATETDISYLDSKKQLKSALISSAAAILTTADLAETARKRGCSTTLLIVAQPQVAFIEIMLRFRPLPPRSTIGISPRAIVGETTVLGEGCNLFPNAYIGENVTLGKNCEVGPGAVIHDGCTVGDDCTVHANAVLYRSVTLKNRVIIHANAVVGADGFGYRFEDGQFIRIPHTGTVIIEDDVEIGAATTVDRGMIGATVIGRGTKLDNQVMIAHNCQIGKHNAYASQVGIAGSCTTGDYVQMGGQVGVVDHANIGTGVKIGGKAGVVGNLPDSGSYHGIPAIKEKEAIRNHFSIQRLPEIREQVKQLTDQILELQQQHTTQLEQIEIKPAA